MRPDTAEKRCGVILRSHNKPMLSRSTCASSCPSFTSLSPSPPRFDLPAFARFVQFASTYLVHSNLGSQGPDFGAPPSIRYANVATVDLRAAPPPSTST